MDPGASTGVTVMPGRPARTMSATRLMRPLDETWLLPMNSSEMSLVVGGACGGGGLDAPPAGCESPDSPPQAARKKATAVQMILVRMPTPGDPRSCCSRARPAASLMQSANSPSAEPYNARMAISDDDLQA